MERSGIELRALRGGETRQELEGANPLIICGKEKSRGARPCHGSISNGTPLSLREKRSGR